MTTKMRWKDHLEVGKQSTYHIYKLVVALVAGVFVARALGPENLGSLALIYSICFILAPCISLASGLNLLKELRNSSKTQSLAWSEAANKLTYKLGTFIITLLIVVLLVTSNLNEEIGLQISIFCIIFYLLATTIELKGTSTLLVVSDLKYKLKRDCVASTICSALKLASTTLPSPEYIILGSFVANLGESLFMRVSNLSHTKKLKGEMLKDDYTLNDTNQRDKIKILLKEGLHLLPTSLISEISESVKKFSLAFSPSLSNERDIGKKMVGEYSIAQRQAVLFTITGQTLYEKFAGATPPKIAVFYTIGAAAITALTLPLIPLLYGPAFQGAITAGAILLIPNSLSIISQSLIAIMVSMSLTRIAARIRTVSAATTLLLCPLLAAKFSIAGIALAMLIGESLCIIWAISKMKKDPRIPKFTSKLN